MDTERWQILLTALDKGSLRAAGDELGYTVSGISRSVAVLEEELGFPLLYRSKAGVQPTPACADLLPAVRELLYAQQKIEQAAARVRGSEAGTIGIGTAYRRYYRWITQVTSLFRARHPGVQFRILNGTSTELIAALQEHRLDFCIISAREGAHGWLPLRRDPLVAVVPAVSPLAAQPSIPVEIFAKEPYIATCPGQDIDSSRFFAEVGLTPNIQFTTADIQATYAMVGAGLGVTVTNRMNSNRQDTDVLHLPLDPPKEIELGLACGQDLPPAAEAFLDFIRDQLPREVE